MPLYRYVFFLLPFLCLTSFSFAQSISKDSLSIILTVPNDSVYWYVNDDIRSSSLFFHSDTIRVAHSITLIRIVPKSRRSSNVLQPWLISRSVASADSIVRIRFSEEATIYTNPEFQLIAGGFKNVRLIVAEGEHLTFQGDSLGTGIHRLSVSAPKLRYTSTNVHSSTSSRYSKKIDQRFISEVYVDSRPKKVVFMGLSLLPGASQMYAQRFLPGILLASGTLYSGYRMSEEIQTYNQKVRLMNRLKAQYDRADDFFVATQLGERISSMEPNLDDRRQKIAVFAGITGSLYALHWVSSVRIARRMEWFATVNPEKLGGVSIDF